LAFKQKPTIISANGKVQLFRYLMCWNEKDYYCKEVNLPAGILRHLLCGDEVARPERKEY